MKLISRIDGMPCCDICRGIIDGWTEIIIERKNRLSWFICKNCISSYAYENKDPIASQMGKRGGSKGGKARAASLTSERRKEIATLAANKRWNKPTPPTS